MKLLVDASLLTYGKAGIYSEIQSFLHNPQGGMNTFDTFDKINPDIYFADVDLVTEAVLKNIEERPALRVVFFEGENESPNKLKIENKFGNLYDFKIKTFMADLVDYGNSKFVKDYECNLVSINETLPDFIYDVDFPECVKFRVFSDTFVGFGRYCGSAPVGIRKNIYKSSALSIASKDNYYNSIICDCCPIAPSCVQELFDAMETDYSEKLKSLKEEVYENNNNFSSLASILNELGYTKEASKVAEKSKELK